MRVLLCAWPALAWPWPPDAPARVRPLGVAANPDGELYGTGVFLQEECDCLSWDQVPAGQGAAGRCAQGWARGLVVHV